MAFHPYIGSMKRLRYAALMVMAATCVFAGTSALSLHDRNQRDVDQADLSRRKEHGSNTNLMVRPGLLADRQLRRVQVFAESIRLSPGTPVEFPLITRNSGKDYEALAVSFASAQDIHDALVFTGLTPGHGVDPASLRFWPKGARVRMTFEYHDDSAAGQRRIPMERLVKDTRTSSSLPESGVVFTGSEWVANPAGSGTVYAADAFAPGAIVSLYNDGFTVMDVPRKVAQHEVYSYQVPNPDFLLPSNQLIGITFEPFFPSPSSHLLDLTLEVLPASPGTPGEPTYTLADGSESFCTKASFPALLACFERLSSSNRELFVSVRPEDDLSVADMRQLARRLGPLDSDQGIRVETPAGHPYFRAFLPDERHRLRPNRPSITAELNLYAGAGSTSNVLIRLTPEWKDDDTPVFHEERIPVRDPAALDAALRSAGEAPTAILIFADKTLSYGSLRRFAEPLLKNHSILYCFERN